MRIASAFRLALLAIALLAARAHAEPAPAAQPAAFDTTSALEQGRVLRDALRIHDAARLWQDYDEPMRAAMGSVEQLEQTLEGIADQTGRLLDCIQDKAQDQAGYVRYTAWCRYEKVPMPLVLTFVFNPSGKVSGMWVKPDARPAPTAFADYQTRTPLQLPFHGEWTVVWGGSTMQDNYHVVARDQRFAYDLVVVKDGSSHAGEGRLNSDYHCFGLPIVAPAAGRVVWLESARPDNPPGRMDPRNPVGNAVVLDHGNGEFSVLAHLQRGSVRAKRGQAVAAGDTLGLCGNSGNSSEPHLHYHLQNGPDLYVWDGLPALFNDYLVGDSLVVRGEPVRNERVRRK